MIAYRFLTNLPIDRLHSAFVSAFADYQVDMRMSLAEFEYRLLRDGVDASLSAGAFHNDQLVGLCLNAAGLWQGVATVYDAGTGVLPQYRGQGIATQLFQFIVPRMKELGYAQYLLEVLTTNEPAVALYRRLGFMDTRRLAVFRSHNRITNLKPPPVHIRETSNPDWDLFKTFWSGYPSWQNSIDAVQRAAKTTVVLEAYFDDRCLGYGVVSKTSGNLFQLAVNENYRRKGFGSQLLVDLQRHISSGEAIKVNNVDESSVEAVDFYKAIGFNLVLEQFELSLDLQSRR
jgi:ribosomal protein S18 acetylase RimI-like enzyme